MAIPRIQEHSFEGSEYFFNLERILRWMRWVNRKQDPHPELTAFERGLREMGLVESGGLLT